MLGLQALLDDCVRKALGFTLIELMVTIAVLAIIATVAAPSFSTMLLKQNLNRSVQELVVLMNSARSQSIIERKEITVSLQSLNTNTSSINTQNTVYWAPSGLATLEGGASSIVFDINGRLKNSTVDKKFKICGKGTGTNAKIVTISKNGTIQIITDGTC